MRGRRRPVARLGAALLASLLVACTPDGADDRADDPFVDRGNLAPTFPVVSTTAAPPGAGGADPVAADTTPPPAAGGTPAVDQPAPADPLPEAAAPATIVDPAGDATPGLTPGPPWAELLGATLARLPQYYELRITLGAPAPSSSGSADQTMNVAAFVDVDGDGQIDYELYANLADGGWDGAWFDDVEGTAAYSDDAAMDVLVEGTDLVIRFPPQYVGLAEAFRWSLASEYGTYATLGTPVTIRDEAPDAGAAASFPG